jgi:hypothetical protein
MTDAFDKYMEAARRRRERRPAVTKIKYGKTGISILKRGRVVGRVKNCSELDAFLRGFDPALAERMADAVSGRAEARIQRLLTEET